MGLPELLVRSGAYRDLDSPVIVTSGEFLTPFFVNAEKLCGDPAIDAVLSARGGEDGELIEYACARAEADETFGSVVTELARVVGGLLEGARAPVVSGGQRRDWLFSGPVARRLGLEHASLYKQAPGQEAGRDRMVLRSPRGEERPAASLEGRTAVHVADMVTAASSCHARDPVSGREVGWVPMLRERGAEIRDLVAVVSRRQGGEEALAAVGVKVRSLAAVDEVFLARHSRHPEQAAAYYRDPAEWTRSELRRRGIGLLSAYLSEDPKKLPRLLKLARTYRVFLEAEGLWAELDAEARARLGRGLGELLGA